MQKLNESNLE